MYLICYLKRPPLHADSFLDGPFDLPLTDENAHILIDAKLEQVAARYIVKERPPGADQRHRLTVTNATWDAAWKALVALADAAMAAEIGARAFLADRDMLNIPEAVSSWWAQPIPPGMKVDLAPTANAGRLAPLAAKRKRDAVGDELPHDTITAAAPRTPRLPSLQARMDAAEVSTVRIRRSGAVWIVHLEAPTATAAHGITEASAEGWPEALDAALARLEQEISVRLGRVS